MLGCDGYKCSEEEGGKIKSTTLHWKMMEDVNVEWESTLALQPKCLTEFLTEWRRDGGNPERMKELFKELEETCQSAESPFESQDTLKLTLKPGVILKFQMNKEDMTGIRLLRFGSDCHICLSHVNGGAIAFPLFNEELRNIAKVEKLMSALEKQKTFKTYNFQLNWIGEYNSVGYFSTEVALEAGDFLCIRRELKKYVWVAHAVVVEVKKECEETTKIKFFVCKFYQTEKLLEGRYLVEVLKDEKSLESISE